MHMAIFNNSQPRRPEGATITYLFIICLTADTCLFYTLSPATDPATVTRLRTAPKLFRTPSRTKLLACFFGLLPLLEYVVHRQIDNITLYSCLYYELTGLVSYVYYIPVCCVSLLLGLFVVMCVNF